MSMTMHLYRGSGREGQNPVTIQLALFVPNSAFKKWSFTFVNSHFLP